jgi:RNA polymerase sigma factor (sigma-70 family)
MSTPQTAALLRHLGPWGADRWDDPHSDRELLQRFAARRDEAAFAALVRRHGPMVLSVCRRILHQAQDAEDAFQATFLVLFRKAGAHGWRDSVGGWLHRVAVRIALHLRARGRKVSPADPAGASLAADPLEQLTVRELLAAFDEELARLPERYREPLVLCYLEGKTQEEAARQLGWSLSTIRRRLESGRKVLHQRLTRRGLELPVALGAVLLSREASAGVPAPLRAALMQAINGSGPARVAFLAQGALGALGVARLKAVAALVALLGVFAAGAGWTACEVLADKREGPTPSAEPPRVEAGRPAPKDCYGDPLPPGTVARMGSLQLRHTRARIAFAPEGNTLTSISGDGTIRVWDVKSGRQVRQTTIDLSNTPGSITLDTPSPDGKNAAGFGNDSLRLFDTATGKEKRRLPAEGVGHRYLCYSADGKWLATLIGIADNYTIRLWDTATGKERLCLRRLSQAHTLLLSSNGKLLAYGQGDEIHIVDTSTRRELRKGRVGGRGWAFSPDGKLLATATYKGEVTLWQTEGLKKLAILQPTAAVAGRIIETPRLCFSPDGKLLAVSGLEILVLWDVAGRKERRRLADRTAREVVFSPDGKTLACAGDFEIRLWDVASGERLHARPGHDSYVSSVAVSPDGNTIASVSHTDPVVRLWDAATGKPLGSARHDSWIRSCAFAPDGRLLVSGGFGVIRLLDVSSGEERRRFVVKDLKSGLQNQEVLVSHISPDGKRLAVVSEHGAAQLTVWDARSGERLACRPFGGSLDACFTPDGDGVSVSGHTQLTIEDTRTGVVRATIPGDLGRPVAFSPDGKIIAVGIHKSVDGPVGGYKPLGVRVAEVVTGEELFRVKGWIDFTTFTSDGRRLITADADGLRLWDVRSGERLALWKWPKDAARGPLPTAINSLALLPDSRRLTTGMNDGTLLVWDLAPETWPKTDLVQHLDRQKLEAAWFDLAGDARKAHRAIYALAASPKDTVPFLAERLRPVATVEAKKVDRLLTELDSDEFRVREAAARQLADMGMQIEPALQRALENEPSLEMRKRVGTIQAKLHGVPPAATLRALRAQRVLEAIGTPEARQLLRMLAAGAAGALETRDAAAALERLKRGPSTSP